MSQCKECGEEEGSTLCVCNEEGKTFCDLPEKSSITDEQLEDYHMILFKKDGTAACNCPSCIIRLDKVIKRKKLTFKTVSSDNCAEGVGANKGICKATYDENTGEICFTQNDMPITSPVQGRLYSENAADWEIFDNDKAQTGEYELPPLTLSWTNTSCNVCYQVVIDRFMDAYFSNKQGGDDSTSFKISAQISNGWNGTINLSEAKGFEVENHQGTIQDYIDLNLERHNVGPIVCPGDTVTFTMQGKIIVENPDHTAGGPDDGDWVGWHYKALMTQYPVRYECNN